MWQTLAIPVIGGMILTHLALTACGAVDEITQRVVQRHGDALRPGDLGSAEVVDLVGRLPVKVDPSVVERLRTAPRGSDARADAVRQIGRAFLDGDGDLLVGPHEEFREHTVDTTDPTGAVVYDRYVRDLRVEGGSLTLVVDNQTGEIRGVLMAKFDCSPALLAAVAAPHLTEAQVGEIIKPHLGPKPYYNWELRRMQSTTDGGATLGRFTKTVVADPPYVVWVVQTGGARYRVDARTGAILGKELPPPRENLY